MSAAASREENHAGTPTDDTDAEVPSVDESSGPHPETMTEVHLARVREIEIACFSDPWPLAAFRREVAGKSGGGYPRVLLDEGEVRAFAISWFVADEASLGNLAVDPRDRRRGYGRILVEDLLAEAERRAVTSIWLEVRAGNAEAQRLYHRHGFRVVGVRKGYYRKEGEDALVMGLNLAGRRESSRARNQRQG